MMRAPLGVVFNSLMPHRKLLEVLDKIPNCLSNRIFISYWINFFENVASIQLEEFSSWDRAWSQSLALSLSVKGNNLVLTISLKILGWWKISQISEKYFKYLYDSSWAIQWKCGSICTRWWSTLKLALS